MLGVRSFTGCFERPAGFDAQGFLRGSLPFAPSPHRVEVRLELPLAEARRRVLPHRMILEAEGDATVLRCGSGDLEWMAAMLMSLKCPMSVRHPPELIDAFASLAKRATAIGMTRLI
jgi:hypothetical protein